VHYLLKGDTQAKPITFKNRRLPLVGIEAESENIADSDELLFFSNEMAPNGQIKSWLHEHDSRYIGPNKGKEIAGGVAVNEKNIIVMDMDRKQITTQVGKLDYNMKWLSDSDGMEKKTAYLKDVWLAVCADLYAEHYRPVELRWSYPGSMSSLDRLLYKNIYESLPQLTPICDSSTHQRLTIPSDKVKRCTEAVSVCKYALSLPYGLNDNMFLGIDVGGSTSDILLLAKDINQNNEYRLYKQSSIRMAAGVFFDAVIKSSTFRQAIFDFHQSQRRIKVAGIQEILQEGNKAPFYLNNIFDQLTNEDFGSFYNYISLKAPFVYAIPAYVTGLLVFYAGKLCAKTIRENNLTAVRKVFLMPFGKGGRLFYWLRSNPGNEMTNAYFEECFRKGYGEGCEDVRLESYQQDISIDNKSEVSKGLATNRELNYYDDDNDNANMRATSSDILGEKNIRYLQNGQFIDLPEDETVIDDYFERVSQFKFPARLENFEEFLQLFIDFVGRKTGLVRNIAILENRSKELPIMLSSFIENDPEYEKARTNKLVDNKFEYHFPILIAEGMCYLEKILIPELFK
jgi:hypothetical protein